MDSPIQICQARKNDAGVISRILMRSIKTGCAIDHRNDSALVEAWSRGKSADQVAAWLADESLLVRLALLHGKPSGMAMAKRSGHVCLCYVQPEFFRRGVGQALMDELETQLAVHGCVRAMLHTTLTGLHFYSRLGYSQTDPALCIGGLTLTPMEKSLTGLRVR